LRRGAEREGAAAAGNDVVDEEEGVDAGDRPWPLEERMVEMPDDVRRPWGWRREGEEHLAPVPRRLPPVRTKDAVEDGAHRLGIVGSGVALAKRLKVCGRFQRPRRRVRDRDTAAGEQRPEPFSHGGGDGVVDSTTQHDVAVVGEAAQLLLAEHAAHARRRRDRCRVCFEAPASRVPARPERGLPC
jgi:hypothetical protein